MEISQKTLGDRALLMGKPDHFDSWWNFVQSEMIESASNGKWTYKSQLLSHFSKEYIGNFLRRLGFKAVFYSDVCENDWVEISWRFE